MNCACRSVAKPGNGRVIASLPLSPPLATPGQDAALDRRQHHARRLDHLLGGAEELEPRVLEHDAAAGDAGRHGVGAGLDPVGDDRVAGAVQRAARPRCVMLLVPAPSILAPIATRQCGEVDDLGLARGTGDQASRPRPAPPPSAGSRSHRPTAAAGGSRPRSGRPVPARGRSRPRARSWPPAAPCPSGAGRSGAGRWRSRPAARPGRRRCAPAAAPAPAPRRASCARGRRVPCRSGSRGACSTIRPGSPATWVAETPRCCSSCWVEAMSARSGTLARSSGSVGQQAGAHDRQGRVLGPADLDGAFERHAALDEDAVHGRSRRSLARAWAGSRPVWPIYLPLRSA